MLGKRFSSTLVFYISHLANLDFFTLGNVVDEYAAESELVISSGMVGLCKN